MTMLGTLTELASIAGMPSEPTLRKLISSDPDFEGIVKRGSNGDAYEIDLEKAARYILGLEAKKEEASRARQSELAQLGFDLGLGTQAPTPGLSIADRKSLLEEEVIAVKLAKLRGELVSKASVEAALAGLLVKLQQQGATFGARLAKRADVSRALQIEIDRLMESDQRALGKWLLELGEIGTLADDDVDADSADLAPAALDGAAA